MTRPESQTVRRSWRRPFSLSATLTWYAVCRAPRPSAANSQVSLGISTSVPSSVSAYSTVVRSIRSRPAPEASAAVPADAAAVSTAPEPRAAEAPAPATEVRRKARRFQPLVIWGPLVAYMRARMRVAKGEGCLKRFIRL